MNIRLESDFCKMKKRLLIFSLSGGRWVWLENLGDFAHLVLRLAFHLFLLSICLHMPSEMRIRNFMGLWWNKKAKSARNTLR